MTKHDNSKPMGCSKSSSKRKFKQYKSYLKGKKKKQPSNRQPNVTPKPIGKGRTTTTKPKLVEGKKS